MATAGLASGTGPPVHERDLELKDPELRGCSRSLPLCPQTKGRGGLGQRGWHMHRGRLLGARALPACLVGR